MKPHPSPGGPRAIPRRSRLTVLIPVAVIVCTLAIISWSAWPLLRSARMIKIEQAIPASLTQTNAQSTTQTHTNTQSINPSPASTRVVQAAGWLEAEPYPIAATALTPGIIDEMLILEGDRVTKDQPLARMVDQDAILELNQAQAKHDMARAALALANARLTAAEQNWNEPYELERAIQSNQAHLDGLRAQLAQLPALIRTQQALLLQAQEEHKRTESAFQRNAASEIEFIKARESANAQSARLEATQAQEAILDASIQQARADLSAANRALQLRIDDREQLDAALAQAHLAAHDLAYRAALRDQAKLELDRMTIRSPITGFVQRRHKAPGDKVLLAMDDPHSAHIAHIYDPSKLQVRVDVPLADASQIFTGQQCEVIVEVMPDRVFQGEVLIVTHQADLQKNTLQIKVRVIDPDPVLRPEMLTRVKFFPGQSAEQASTQTSAQSSAPSSTQTNPNTAVRIPATALDTTSTTDRVWIVTQRQSGQGILKPIEVSRVVSRAPSEVDSKAQEHNGWVTITGNLQPGTIIAADPAPCTPNERIRFIPKKGGPS